MMNTTLQQLNIASSITNYKLKINISITVSKSYKTLAVPLTHNVPVAFTLAIFTLDVMGLASRQFK